jgi:hypothetical protein
MEGSVNKKNITGSAEVVWPDFCKKMTCTMLRWAFILEMTGLCEAGACVTGNLHWAIDRV